MRMKKAALMPVPAQGSREPCTLLNVGSFGLFRV